MPFKDKVIWITGASSGIGAELTKQFVMLGSKLILTARNESALISLRDSFTEKNTIDILPGDMLLPDSLDALTASALAIHGYIDILILNAGQSQRSLVLDTSMEVHRHLMELNFFAPAKIAKLLLPHFIKRNEGYIVAISSVAGLMGFPLRSGYSASKHALKGFFETLQIEHNASAINFMIVSPGRVKTPISINSIMGNGNVYGTMDNGQINGIRVEVCARKIITGIKNQKKHVIIARSERLLWWLWWYCRPLYYQIAFRKGMPAQN